MAQTERLLEGENPSTLFRQDARHWIAVCRGYSLVFDDRPQNGAYTSVTEGVTF